MVALSRCLGSLALFVTSAVGVRARTKHEQKEKGEVKFIAGVPVFNYQGAYGGDSLGKFDAEEEWVVMFNKGVTTAQIQKVCEEISKCKMQGNPSEGGVPFIEMRGTERDLEAVIERGHGAVKFIEPDTLVYAIPELEADNIEAGLWGLERISASTRSSRGNGVTIFVLDTGVRVSHQDFGGRAVPGFDMTSGSLVECGNDRSCAGDAHGHGSHCAGTAAGTNYGVAPAATIRSGKVLSDQGGGSWSWSIAALDWLATSSIRPVVASMSLGGSGTQQAMRDAVDAATGSGVTVVVAGGNSNSDACGFSPAFVPSAITVGSTTSTQSRSSFSNYGRCTDIWAPGSSILSVGISSDTATSTHSGTSMACPHVSGGAALVLEQNPSFNYAKVLQRLLANARRNSITGLKTGDTNAELYVGSDAPPPPGSVPPGGEPPVKECPAWCSMFCVPDFCNGGACC